MNLDLVKNKITEKGLKFTHQRMVIFHAINEATLHPSADRVFESIKSDNPTISLGTVYKTLDCFVQAGIIQKFMDHNGVMRFDAILETHSQLYFKDSHEIRDYKNEDLEKLIQGFIQDHRIEGFDVEEITVVFKGFRNN